MDDLKAISDREPYPQLKVNSQIKAMINETTVWSEELFDPPKSLQGRFSISAIHNIFELVEVEVTDEAIRRHQSAF
ncbi:hypothetical protein OA528_02905 [Gammaproteobacteria bacterium]|nr:hypothetical protein [Gammaproteobacteria bacterium]